MLGRRFFDARISTAVGTVQRQPLGRLGDAIADPCDAERDDVGIGSGRGCEIVQIRIVGACPAGDFGEAGDPNGLVGTGLVEQLGESRVSDTGTGMGVVMMPPPSAAARAETGTVHFSRASRGVEPTGPRISGGGETPTIAGRAT
ncbi:hypothetical protein GCM10027597_24080 [Saccharopolyspora tripterygii]